MKSIKLNYFMMLLMLSVGSPLLSGNEHAHSDARKPEAHRISERLSKLSRDIRKNGSTENTFMELDNLKEEIRHLCEGTDCGMCKVHMHHLEHREQDIRRHADQNRCSSCSSKHEAKPKKAKEAKSNDKNKPKKAKAKSMDAKAKSMDDEMMA